MIRLVWWLLRHPGALLDMARGATLRDLILREDLRRLGYAVSLEKSQGLAETRLNVRVVDKLARAFDAAPPRTLLDVGAARGSFSKAAAVAFEGVRTIAFEPLPEEFEVLERHVEQAFPCALGDEPGSATLHVSANPGSSSLVRMLGTHVAAFPGTDVVREQEIQVRRLDDLVAAGHVELEPPVLMKIDVQGAEDRVLRGAAGTLAGVDALVVEMSLTRLYEGQLLAAEMKTAIESLGFRYDGTFTELRSWDGELTQIDGIFRRA